MDKKKTDDITGYSDQDIKDALRHALEQTERSTEYRVVETRSVQLGPQGNQYEVTLAMDEVY